MDVIVVDEDSFDTARTEEIGFCTGCEDFTTPGVSPVEKHRECADCGEDTVLGADRALKGGFIEVRS